MRIHLAFFAIIAGLFVTSGACAADMVTPASIDWDLWGEWLREAVRMPIG
ncbi:hypothetical protein PQR62_12885 [Herbaspirillum lusitanum]|uniref:Uncharacterized protein n=1 Tax=Herbaspirillum lusitanum TaxID=213312 RepID=A0ABW9A9U5_9BURK